MSAIPITHPNTQVTGPQLYRSFGGYQIPFHPVGPLTFPETEGMAAYNLVYRDDAGRVARFDKIRLVWQEKERRDVALTVPTKPDAPLYFKVVPGAVPGKVGVGEQITYDDTDQLEEFFAGHVGPSGKTGQVRWIRREIAFTDLYEYWPNGRLRRRFMSSPGKGPTEQNYNADGKLIGGAVASQ